MTWSALEPLLEGTGYPYARQGSFAEEGPLPDSFFTFWNISTPEAGFYDNEPMRAVWEWQVCFYTSDPALLYSAMDSLTDSAREAGFVLDGRARDIDANEPGYCGRMARFIYMETI